MRSRLAKLTQPTKLLDSLRVRRFRRAFARLPVESGRSVAYLGTQQGGWAVPEGLIGSDWVCYCVGAGHDISFELELIDRYGCEVVSFDPAPGAEAIAADAAAGRSSFTFMCVGVADEDGTMRMWTASDPSHIALSSENLQRTNQAVDVPVRSLPSVMAELRHQRIDLLKLAVEGLEYELVPKLDLPGMGVKVLAVEFNGLVPPSRAAGLLDEIRSQGYAPIFRNPPDREMPRTTVTFLRTELLGASG